MPALNPLLASQLHRLVCPVCLGTLRLEKGTVDCTGCGRSYPVIDGLPVLMASRTVDDTVANIK